MQGTKEEWQEQALLVLVDIFSTIILRFGRLVNLLPHVQIATQHQNMYEAFPKHFVHPLRNITRSRMLQD